MSKSLQFRQKLAPAIMSCINIQSFPDAKPEQGITVTAVWAPNQKGKNAHLKPMGIITYKWINKNGIAVEMTQEQFNSYNESKEGMEAFKYSIRDIDSKMKEKGIKIWNIHLLTPIGLTEPLIECNNQGGKLYCKSL
jgi:hypothetical protein